MNSRDNDTRSSRIIRVTYANNLHKLEWRRIKRLRSRRNVYFVFKRNSVSSIEFRKNSVFQTYVDSNTSFFSNPFGWYFDNRQNVDPCRIVSNVNWLKFHSLVASIHLLLFTPGILFTRLFAKRNEIWRKMRAASLILRFREKFERCFGEGKERKIVLLMCCQRKDR